MIRPRDQRVVGRENHLVPAPAKAHGLAVREPNLLEVAEAVCLGDEEAQLAEAVVGAADLRKDRGVREGGLAEDEVSERLAACLQP